MADVRPSVFPTLPNTGHYRDAEKLVYQACGQLPTHWYALYSVCWIRSGPRGAVDGESDFVFIGPEIGLVVLEVKGGRIGRDKKSWYSIDRHGDRYQIKDPISQAKNGRYAILDYLRQKSRPLASLVDKLASAHMVSFPNVDRRDLPSLIELPSQRIIAKDDLGCLSERLREGVMLFEATQPKGPLSISECKTLADALMPTFEASPRWPYRWLDQYIDKLTDEQRVALETLEGNKKISLTGPAGSGKTIAGLRHAKRITDTGHSVLCIVPSKALRDYYASVLGSGLSKAMLGEHIQQPLTGQWAWIVLDEAQDISIPAIEAVYQYCECNECNLLVIHDSNQRLGHGEFDVGRDFVRVELTKVLRNTREIGSLSTRFYLNSRHSPEVLGPSGAPIHEIAVQSEEDIPEQLALFITDLVENEGFSFRDIVVLFGRTSGKKIRANAQRFAGITYRDAGRVWAEGCDDARCVACSGVSAFRGMESQVVILCEVDDLIENALIEACYVGTSRARLRLAIAGLPGTLERIRAIDLNPITDRRERSIARRAERRKGTERLSQIMSLGTTHLAKVTGIQPYGVFFELIGVNCPGLMRREAITRDKTLDLGGGLQTRPRIDGAD
jgi:hypothetical protein